jgi:outer membrane transport energization protein ExbD (TC 2.C.1.1.1)
LVLLIIFLITVPVVTHTVPVNLPIDRNQPAHNKPSDITISVDSDGHVFWNTEFMPDSKALLKRLTTAAAQDPQPQVHVRGDGSARYEAVGKVVLLCQRAGMVKVSFIIQPPAHN